MTLDEYLIKTKTSQGEFGSNLKPPVSQGLISQWTRGVTRITLEYALQIEELTTGDVTPRDCSGMFRDRDDKKAA